MYVVDDVVAGESRNCCDCVNILPVAFAINDEVEFLRVGELVLKQIADAPRYIVACIAFVVPQVKLYMTNIVLDAERGVMDALIIVISDVLVEVEEVVNVVLTTCKTLPAGRADAAIVPVN